MIKKPIQTDLKKGDRIQYWLAPAYGWFLPGVVINVTPRRVVVRLDGYDKPRNTLPAFLTRENDDTKENAARGTE